MHFVNQCFRLVKYTVLKNKTVIDVYDGRMRVNFAKGYSIYFKIKDEKVIILLVGGDKSTQQKDIRKAKKIWKEISKK